MLNFKMSEFLHSDVANKYNIRNIPSNVELDNLLNLIVYTMQPIRNLISKPILITSGFRCVKLNNKVKGKKNSQHIKGQAADFIIKGVAISDIISIVSSSNIEFDQIINEHNKWVHISFAINKNRRQVLSII